MELNCETLVCVKQNIKTAISACLKHAHLNSYFGRRRHRLRHLHSFIKINVLTCGCHELL